MADAIGLSGRRVWGMALSVVSGVLVARVLGPTDYGLLAALSCIPTLALYGTFGWQEAAMRELPHLRSLGQTELAGQVRDTAYSAELLLTIGWIAVALLAMAFAPSWRIRVGLLAGAISLLLNKLISLLQLERFVEKDFRIQARVGVAMATIASVTQLILAWRFGAVAAFAGSCVASAVGVWLYARAHPLRWRFRIDATQLRRLTRIGLPMAILGLLAGSHALMTYLDRSLIGATVGLQLLGLYVFGTNLARYAVGLLDDVVRAYQPHLLESLARARDPVAVKRCMEQPSIALAYVSALSIAMILAGLPALVLLALPKYAAVVPVLPIFFLASGLVAVYELPGVLLCSAFASQQTYYTTAWAATMAAFAACLWLAMRAGLGLAGAAWSTVVSALVVVGLTLPRALRYYFASSREAATHVLQQVAPVVYVVAVHAAAIALVQRGGVRLWMSPGMNQLAASAAALAVCAVPLAWGADRQFGLRRLWRVRTMPAPVAGQAPCATAG